MPRLNRRWGVDALSRFPTDTAYVAYAAYVADDIHMMHKQKTRLVYGCMRLAGDGSAKAERVAFSVLDCAVELGVSIFDHADIYGDGLAETVFGRWLARRPGLRDSLVINTKCGIRPAGGAVSEKHYDFSSAHILGSVQGSLSRLNVDNIDTLILHRCDHLYDSAEVGAAFAQLHKQSLVRGFGVSNFSTHQLSRAQRCWRETFRLHQMQINVGAISALFDGRLEQCLDSGIAVQAWSPLAGVAWPHENLNAPARAQVMEELLRQGQLYGIDAVSVMLTWIMRHPAGIAPVVGTTNTQRLTSMVEQTRQIDYGREHWYQLLSLIRQRPLE